MEQLDLTHYSPNRPQIEKVRYTHDAMIDLVVQNPWISQNELAIHFGYSASWISSVFSSDAFQARLAARKDELVDPTIRATLEERMKALVFQSIAVLQKKLETDDTGDLALGVLNGAAKALGYGARNVAPVQVNNFVVHVPPKSANPAEWEKDHAHIGQLTEQVREVNPLDIPSAERVDA